MTGSTGKVRMGAAAVKVRAGCGAQAAQTAPAIARRAQ